MSDKLVFEDTVRSAFAGVSWTHKIHEKQADIYYAQFKVMETAKITISVLASIGIVSLIISDPLWLKIISALISGGSAFISTYYQSFKTYEQIENHKNTARELLALRDRYIHLLLKIKINDDVSDLIEEFETLEKDKHKIYDTAPITTKKAVNLAREALNVSHDNNYTDDEIDGMLPESLQKEKEVHAAKL